ncbi:MAG: RebB family R body protein [Pseudomonadota bacterium]
MDPVRAFKSAGQSLSLIDDPNILDHVYPSHWRVLEGTYVHVAWPYACNDQTTGKEVFMPQSTEPASPTQRTLADAYPMALGNLMQVFAHSQGLALENAVQQQSQAAILGQAALAQGIAQFLGDEQGSSATVLNALKDKKDQS